MFRRRRVRSWLTCYPTGAGTQTQAPIETRCMASRPKLPQHVHRGRRSQRWSQLLRRRRRGRRRWARRLRPGQLLHERGALLRPHEWLRKATVHRRGLFDGVLRRRSFLRSRHLCGQTNLGALHAADRELRSDGLLCRRGAVPTAEGQGRSLHERRECPRVTLRWIVPIADYRLGPAVQRQILRRRIRETMRVTMRSSESRTPLGDPRRRRAIAPRAARSTSSPLGHRRPPSRRVRRRGAPARDACARRARARTR